MQPKVSPRGRWGQIERNSLIRIFYILQSWRRVEVENEGLWCVLLVWECRREDSERWGPRYSPLSAVLITAFYPQVQRGGRVKSHPSSHLLLSSCVLGPPTPGSFLRVCLPHLRLSIKLTFLSNFSVKYHHLGMTHSRKLFAIEISFYLIKRRKKNCKKKEKHRQPLM